MPWLKLGDVVAHVRMSRPRRKRCGTCKVIGAQLECDGCDKPLCAGCSVSPRDGFDWCPSCFEPAWKRWLSRNGHASTLQKPERRRLFRAWVRSDVATFMKLVPMGETARRAWETAP